MAASGHRWAGRWPRVAFATGFTHADDFSSYTADGLDWALSFGGKFGDYVKSAGKLGTVLRGANGMLESLDGAARLKALKDVALKPGVEAEIYGVAKSLISGSLIDTDLQSITVVDIPLAGVGAEIGIYYAKTGYKVFVGVVTGGQRTRAFGCFGVVAPMQRSGIGGDLGAMNKCLDSAALHRGYRAVRG